MPDFFIGANGLFDWARGPSVPLRVPLKGSFHFNFANHIDGYSHTLHGTARNFGDVFLGSIQPESVEVGLSLLVAVKIDALHRAMVILSGKLPRGGRV